MGRFDSLLAQVSDGGRFSSVLDKVDGFGWEDVSPILERRRKPAGGYEYRPNPARGQGAPGVGVLGEDLRERAIREAQERTSIGRPQSLPEQIMEQLKPRVAANVASMPELASAAQGIAEKLNPGMRPRRPLPPGASPTELLNPRTLYPEAVKAPVERIYSAREEAAQALARNLAEAGYSPGISAAADLGLEVTAMALDPTNALPGIGMLGKINRGARFLADLPDAMLSREASLAAQLPEAPIPAPRTRGAETLARALGEKEIAPPETSGRLQIRDGDFPPDLDPWIRRKGLDPDRMGYREKLDLYGEMNAEERAAHLRDFGKEDPAPAPLPELTRERWEEIRNLPASRLAAGNPLVEQGLAKPSEIGALRIGPDPVRADPATEAFRASVFQEQPARPPVAERLKAVKDKLLAEFVSASDPYVARMTKAGAGPEAEVMAHELRRAGHTALQPITYATRRWDPTVKQWDYTGEPLEAWTARMDEATQRQVEAVLAAETQAEFAGRYEKAKADYGFAKAQKRAERLVLHEEGKIARAGIRGIEAEARVLRAEELRAARAAGRATGRTQTLSPLVSRAQAAGKRADEALRDLVHAARDSEEAADAAARILVRERAWRDVAEQGAGRRANRAVERAAYESGVSDAALDAAYEAVTAGRRARGAAGRELTAAEKRLAAAQAERARLEGVRGRAAEASRKKLDEVIRANREEARAAVAREKQRAKISRLERPADLDLDIDQARTVEARAYLAQMQGSGDLARLQPHLDAARDYMDRAFLQPLERLGVFSPAELAEIRAKNQHYSILTRAEERIGQELRSGEALATKTSPVGRRTTGLVEDGKYVPPIEAIAMQAARVDKFQVRQMVRNDLAERVIQSPDLFPELMPAKVGEAGTFVAWKDGKQYAIKAPGDLLDVIDNVTPEQSSYVWRAARTGASVLRTLATLAPHFPGMNFLRDQATAAVFSQSKRLFGFVPYYSPAKELVKEIAGKVAGRGGSKAWQDFQASAAGHSTFLRADREGMSRAVKEARMRATPRGRTALKIREAANPLFVPATAGNALESATRIAERELLLREGAGARQATSGAAKVSLDFSDGGRFTKKVNEVVAFFNVRFLDPARFLREIKRRPFTIAARATAFITLPALAEEWLHKDDPGYHDLPLWDQVAFYHVGSAKRGSLPGGLPGLGDFAEGWYKRVPRPLGLVSYVFGLLPQLALRQQLKDDPHAADLAMRGLLQDTPAGLMFAQDEQGGLQPSMEMVPTIARGPAELIANRKWTGAPVVGDPSVPVEQQYTDRTSPFVRELAGAMPDAVPDFLQSPQQLEHLVSAQTAGTGRLALDVLNPLTRKATGEAEPPKEPFSPRDVPVVRNFMSPPPEGFESLPVEDLYRFADRVDALARLLRKVEGSDPGRVRILEATYPEIEVHSETMEAVKELALFKQEREDIKASRIPDDLKRARLRQLDKEVTRYAEDWMKEWRKLYPELLQ